MIDMDSICISLGGSIISESKGINLDYLQKFAKTLIDSKKRFVIVTGGGYTSKQYVGSLRDIHSNEFYLDQVGIKASELNALLTKCVFDSVEDNVAEICDKVGNLKDKKARIIITHGQLPGITTDSVAVLACEAIGCKTLINISNVPYIYDRPPEQKGAKRLERMSHDRLIGLANRYDTRAARSHFIFDIAACKFAKRSSIEVRFINTDLKNLRSAIAGKGYKGTTVK